MSRTGAVRISDVTVKADPRTPRASPTPRCEREREESAAISQGKTGGGVKWQGSSPRLRDHSDVAIEHALMPGNALNHTFCSINKSPTNKSILIPCRQHSRQHPREASEPYSICSAAFFSSLSSTSLIHFIFSFLPLLNYIFSFHFFYSIRFCAYSYPFFF